MSRKRQNNQLKLAFAIEGPGEARAGRGTGAELLAAEHGTESPAGSERLMEVICERENLKEALKRVKSNQGGPGIDGMTVGELPGYLKEHWPGIREQLLAGAYKPQPVKRVEIPKPDGGVQAGHSHGAGPVRPAGGEPGTREALGPDVLRTQLRVSTGAVGSSSGGTGAAIYRRRPCLVR